MAPRLLKPAKNSEILIATKIDRSLYDKLENRAQRDDRSKAAVLRRALELYLSEKAVSLEMSSNTG